MMRRTGFKSRAQQRSQRDPNADRVRSMPTVTPGAFRAPEPVASAPAARVEKSAPVRSEAYRRAVASLPCVICGVPGYTQAAHGSEGKGMALKACDMTLFPACCDRPGVQGCHAKLDQGAMEQFHHDVVEFLRTEHAGKTLWRHLSPVDRITMIETILQGFNE